MKIVTSIMAFALIANASAQTCSSIRSMDPSDRWKPISTAPRDGTFIEVMETYGIAPWYGLFRWTRENPSSEIIVCDPKDGHCSPSPKKTETWLSEKPKWISGDGHSVSDDDKCLFWRPYSGSSDKYKDPTGGAQNGTAYWCAAMHIPYDPKTGYCKR